MARRHSLSRQQIYQWRSAMRRGDLACDDVGPFLAVEFVGSTTADAAGEDVSTPGEHGAVLIEVTLRKGRVLRAPASLAPKVLTALIRAAEAA